MTKSGNTMEGWPSVKTPGLLLVVLGILACSRGISGQFGPMLNCLPPGATNAGNVPELPNLPDSFRVMVEITAEGRNWTEQAQEIFDNAGNRAVITLLTGGMQTTIIYSYDTNEVFHITNMNCTVRNMSTDFYTFFAGSVQYIDGRVHSPSGATALYFGSDVTKVYVGKKEIRGVMCDQWQACLGWASAKENFTIDYYFSEMNWGTPSTYQQVPVRYELNGTQTMQNGQARTFHRIYDFFDFMMDADSDPTVFETPEGVVCPGRKATRSLPDMSSHSYRFREEIVDLAYEQITQADVWYNLDQKLVRVDYRAPGGVGEQSYPLSEVHDYNFGIRYAKNLLTGECTPQALQQNSFDAKLDTVSYLQNGSYVLHMRNPLSFFFLDSNFSYSGQRYARDALCDVFISHRNDYDFFDNGTFYEAKVETYFLADGYMDVPNDAMQSYANLFPYRCHLWMPKLAVNLVYNIFDFDTERPEMSLFNIADCFPDDQRLDFRVRFPGPYKRDTEHMVLLKAQNTLAEVMRVSPLRISNTRLEYDANYIYVAASLLGPAPALAQFTHIPKSVVEDNDDIQWSDVPSAAACSELCVQNPDFTCLSFQYCPSDHQACGLSKKHVGDQGVSVVPGTCDLYSRTVNIRGPAELTIEEAYNLLLENIETMSLSFDIPEDDGSDTVYMAVASDVSFGKLRYAGLPQLPTQFSYRTEFISIRSKEVTTYDVWYDSASKLVRYDSQDSLAGPPYYTPYTVSAIHDFNTGVAYNIDTHRGNCTVTPITSGFDTRTQNASVLATGVNMATMKTPFELFFLDNSTYVFTGQKTVRGILCDVFESRRTDFALTYEGGNGTQHSIFQFYFQSASWSYGADSSDDVTTQQPVSLVILDGEANEFLVYNFYDFNDEHISYDKFDITPCFTDDEQIDFVMDFNKTYHPYLDTHEWTFREEVQLLLSSEVRISPLRIQNIEVTYNMDQTFVIATLLGEVAPNMHFAEDGTTQPYAATANIPDADVMGCASACYYNKDFICNSYDLCDDGTCYLSSKHTPDGDSTGPGSCRHFSRIVNGTTPEPSLTKAFTAIKDIVYKGLFDVIVPLSADGSKDVSYLATGIRSDILRQSAPGETGGGDLKKFSVFKTGAQMSSNGLDVAGLAVDDCATACLAEELFICEAFQYCYTTGDCFLNAVYPTSKAVNITSNAFCDVYARLYTDAYTQYPGEVMESAADDTVKADSVELCAQQCTVSTAFPCRSFDYCPGTGDCQLRRIHMLDANPTSVKNSSICTHYSRNYLYDFSLKSHKVLPGHDNRIVGGTSPLTCADLCLKEGGCLSFEFCDGECRLSTASAKMDPTVKDDAVCDLYIRKDSAIIADRTSTLPTLPTTPQPLASRGNSQPTATTPYIGPPTFSTKAQGPSTKAQAPSKVNNPRTVPTVRPDPPSTRGTGCTSNQQQGGGSSDDTGAMVGLGIGMLVLGMLLGVGLIFLVYRIRLRKTDEYNMELMPRPWKS